MATERGRGAASLDQVTRTGGSPWVTSHLIRGESPGLTVCCSGSKRIRGVAAVILTFGMKNKMLII